MHIAVVTETLLKPNIKLKKNPNYMVHRFDRIDVAGGGVAIVIHRRIKHRVMPHLETKVVESLGIDIETDIDILFIAAVYFPFQCTGEQKNHFKGDLQKLTRNKSKFFFHW